MPRRPPRPCSFPGCPKLTDGQYCSEHKKIMDAQYDRRLRDRDADAFYHSSKWKRLRYQFLSEHPFCEECRRHGRLTRATVADHIIPIRQGGAMLDEDNLQALCSSCHSSKSIKEGSRYGHPQGRSKSL
ncbi:MAG: HNH endonuclease [Spirochaetales bacterium]|nr:HNH endonuclease [Spirochaetales bacterium]